MWRKQGYIIIRNFLNVTPQIHAMSNVYPPSRKDENIHDFGNDRKTTFPCNYEAFNNISVNEKLIDIASYLLQGRVRLRQSVAWAKYGDRGKNEDQRVHMDYGNNMWGFPPSWNKPNAVAMILYYSDTTKTGGGTAVVPYRPDLYKNSQRMMPGQGSIPFANNRNEAEELMKLYDPEGWELRKKCYEAEIRPFFRPGDLLVYRLDLWHRGTPVKKNKIRYVHNFLWALEDAPISNWNSFTQRLYYGWLEKFIRSLSEKQLFVLGIKKKDLVRYNAKL